MILKGTQIHNHKLNEKLVAKIRKERNEAIRIRDELEKKINARLLAKEYGVRKETMLNAINGITWGHVE